MDSDSIYGAAKGSVDPDWEKSPWSGMLVSFKLSLPDGITLHLIRYESPPKCHGIPREEEALAPLWIQTQSMEQLRGLLTQIGKSSMEWDVGDIVDVR